MTKQAEAVLADSMERLKSGETIDRVLGSIAYEHGRRIRDEIAGEIRKLSIKGYEHANSHSSPRRS